MRDTDKFDKDTIRVILSITRLKMLKLLKKRRMMAAELVATMGIKKNAVCKHLKKLIKAGLVKRMDDDKHKWIYYQLTPEGTMLISSDFFSLYKLLPGGL